MKARSLAAGSLNQRVTLFRTAATRDAIGQPITGSVEVDTIWADVRYLSGLATIKADAETAIGKVSVRIRWRTDIDAGWHLTHGTRRLRVDAVLPVEAGVYQDLVCREIK